MTIVDLAKARAFAGTAEWCPECGGTVSSADWINELADEVESLQLAAEKARRSEQAALADAAKAAEENDLLRTALVELLHQVGELVKGLTP